VKGGVRGSVAQLGCGTRTPQLADLAAPGWRTHPAVEEACRGLLLRDPPEHGRLRRIMQAAFSRTRLAALTGRIDQAVVGVLDHLESRLR